MSAEGIIQIAIAEEKEKNLAAILFSSSEPWTTLGITFEKCSRNCNNPEFTLYIAHVEGKMAGAILIDPCGVAGSPYIKSVAVNKEYRGKGIGTRLLSFAEDLFRRDSRFIFICVSSFNLKARKLYEKFGFSEVGELRDYIIEGASEILMHKRL
jgi:ribosomal protein S18 acetylase RimI-like enzyme